MTETEDKSKIQKSLEMGVGGNLPPALVAMF